MRYAKDMSGYIQEEKRINPAFLFLWLIELILALYTLIIFSEQVEPNLFSILALLNMLVVFLATMLFLGNKYLEPKIVIREVRLTDLKMESRR